MAVDNINPAALASFRRAFGSVVMNAAEAEAQKAVVAFKGCVRRAQAIPDGPEKEQAGISGCAAALDTLNARLAAAPKLGSEQDRRTEFEAIRKAAAAALSDYDPRIARARKALGQKLREDISKLGEEAQTAQLAALSADEPGRQKIDAMVSSLDGKAATDADKALVKRAVKARFKVDMTGDMTTKALPRLYELMAQVPDSHTFGNDKLKTVNRIKNFIPESSDYSGGTLNMRCGRAGILEMPDWYSGAEGLGKITSHFNAATLHEVGHSIETRFPFQQFAGWQSAGAEELVNVMLVDKNLRGLAGYPASFLTRYAQAIVAGQDPTKNAELGEIWAGVRALQSFGATRDETRAELLADAGLANVARIRAIVDGRARNSELSTLRERATLSALSGDKAIVGNAVCQALLKSPPATTPAQAVDATLQKFAQATPLPPTPDWAALEKHAAVVWFRSVALKSESKGLWGDGDGAASAAAVGGRVYQEAYRSDWYSYDVGARSAKVTNYQFRAPGEWFAEIYAMYFMGKLPATHPHYQWFKTTVDQ